MDSLLAELLGMGFEMDQIERCREALDLNSSTSFNLQTATEWYLAHDTWNKRITLFSFCIEVAG